MQAADGTRPDREQRSPLSHAPGAPRTRSSAGLRSSLASALLACFLAAGALLQAPPLGAEPPRRYLVLVVAGEDDHAGQVAQLAEMLIARMAQDGVESVGPETIQRDHPSPSSLRRCAVDVGCVSRAASALGAQRVLLGLVSHEPQHVAVTLELIDALGRRSVARSSSVLHQDQLGQGLLALADEVLRTPSATTGHHATLDLRVVGGQALRFVFDGRPVGSGSRWVGTELEPGEHELVIELEGGGQRRRQITLGPWRETLVVRVGGAARPFELHLQQAEQALYDGHAQDALHHAEAALEAGGRAHGEVFLALARACLALLDGPQAAVPLVDRAFDAVRRALDLKAGAGATRLRAELARRFARVRLEPGEGWQDPGIVELTAPARIAPAEPRPSADVAPLPARQALAEAIGRSLRDRAWALPLELRLPRPGAYEINGRSINLGARPEGRPVVLAIPPAQGTGGGLPRWMLGALVAQGIAGGLDPQLGLEAVFGFRCGRTACAVARAELSARRAGEGASLDRPVVWARVGPGVAAFLWARHLRLDASAELLVDPVAAEVGLGLGAAASWALGWGGLRVGLRPAFNLFDFSPERAELGAQLVVGWEG